MARRKSRRRRNYAARTRTVYTKSRSGGGKYKQVIDGLIAGVGAAVVEKFLPVPPGYSVPAAALATGIYRNSPVLKTEGARELGIVLGRQFLGGNMSTGGGGVR